MRAFTAILLLALGGCATVGAHDDPLCSKLVEFANTPNLGETRTVELCTDWGPRCSDETNVLSSASCNHDSYPAGVVLCNFLLLHTSQEFPNANFSRALSCLGRRLYTPERFIDYQWGNAIISTSAMPGLKPGVTITIENVAPTQESAAKLRITAIH